MLSILDVDEIKSVPYVPLSHPFVERLIGTVRREFLDHVLFWNNRDLTRKLETFKDYYNAHRVHSSLGVIHLQRQAVKLHSAKLISTDTSGKRIVEDYFSCHWRRN